MAQRLEAPGFPGLLTQPPEVGQGGEELQAQSPVVAHGRDSVVPGLRIHPVASGGAVGGGGGRDEVGGRHLPISRVIPASVLWRLWRRGLLEIWKELLAGSCLLLPETPGLTP